MALSIAELSEYWISLSTGPMKRSWSGQTCLAVVSYVLKFCSEPRRHDTLSDTIKDLEFLATEYRSSRDDLRKETREKELSEMFVNSFMPKARKFFFDPNDKIPMSNELLAGFIHFLCQVLNSASDQIGGGKKRHDPLQKELTFLLAYLGDKPFQCSQLEQVKDVLAIFEMLAIEAGSFIYACIFARSIKANKISLGVDDLLKKFKLLDANIKEHCIEYGKLPISASKNDVIDSLFVVDSLLDDLENMINHRMDLIDDVINQIRKLHNLLISARTFLNDTNVPHGPKIEELKECMNQIRDLTCEAEYLINSFVVGNFPSWYLTLRLPNIIQNLELIETGFPEVMNIVRNKDLTVLHDFSPKVSSQIVATATIVVGFEEETKKILHELTSSSRKLKVISICGMPGLGKTTLARKLYTDRCVTDHFDKLVWYTVSQTYQKTKLLTDILLTLSTRLEERKLLRQSDDQLSTHIYQILKGRRYLIVLDDVWSSNVWDDLRRFFPDDNNGSRIMFTSRNRDMVPTYSTINILPLLSKDQCLELLQKKVFGPGILPLKLQDIGKQIAEKCNGLPLAVVVVAGILANMEMEIDVWEEVKESLDTYMAADPNNYMNILELSYTHLPDHLKMCFLYLGAFPEDTEIPIRKLICLWIAEGFIQKQKEKNPEHVAEEYLIVLINRSLLLITKNRSTGGVKTCTVHDLVRDMCLKRAHEENFMTTIKDHFSVYQKHNRLCIHSKPLAYSRPFGLHCRSFLGHLSDPQSSFSQMKLLRILDLPTSMNAHYTTEVELKRIDQLFHLRYLAVDRMPETIAIGNLINLEFLRVDSIAKIYVPSILLKVLKLRHLHLRSEAIFEKDYDTSQTNNLQTFSFVRIFDHKDEDILNCSPNLRKLKCICNETLFPDLIYLHALESLTMKFLNSLKGENMEINFPETIKKLALSGIGLSWADMSVVGRLANLQVLKLDNYAFVGEEWKTTNGEFQELKLLRLNSVDLEEWITYSEHFPKLERLILRNCEVLQNIPSEIGDILTLQMIEVHDCSYEASLSAVQIELEQREYGNEDLKVIITNNEWSKEELIQILYQKSRGQESERPTTISL